MNEAPSQPATADRSAAPAPPAAPAADTEEIIAPPAGSIFLPVFPSILLPMFLAVADQTIVATALPAIASSLGGIERASWAVGASLIPTTSPDPASGGLGGQ